MHALAPKVIDTLAEGHQRSAGRMRRATNAR
jgi:hypothetical protein